jgi:hypothetical protein
MILRFVFGLVFTAGYVVLVYDLVRLGRRRAVAQQAALAT